MHIATNSAGRLFRSSWGLQSLVFLEFKPKLTDTHTHTYIYLQMQLSPAEQFLWGRGEVGEAWCTIYILNSAKFIILFEVCPMEALDMFAISPVICPSAKCVLDDFPVNGNAPLHARFVVQAHKQMQLHIK